MFGKQLFQHEGAVAIKWGISSNKALRKREELDDLGICMDLLMITGNLLRYHNKFLKTPTVIIHGKVESLKNKVYEGVCVE